jgi:tetratricopeptide (TPR) repeat protein
MSLIRRFIIRLIRSHTTGSHTMQIHRSASRLTFRKRRRRSGCLSLTVLLGLCLGLAAASWTWIGQRIAPAAAPGVSADLGPARQAFDRGDLDAAVNLAQQALAADPASAAAPALLACALIYRSYSDYNRDRDRESALQITTEALARAGADADNDLLASHAFALQAAGNPQAAAEVARRVLEREPDHVLARVALGLAYSGVGSHEIALSELQRAAQGTTWRLDALRALALAYSGVGDYAAAVRAIENALALNPHLIPLHFERAAYARLVGDADAATVAYFQILAFAPANVKARLRLCELSSTLRERDAAVRYCQEVTELAPTWAEGWYRLGREYFLQGNFQLAQQHFNRCSRLQTLQDVPPAERRFECWYLQGQAAEILGDCDALLATYNEYLAIAAAAGLSQTWVYPPEGPPACVTTDTPTS